MVVVGNRLAFDRGIELDDGCFIHLPAASVLRQFNAVDEADPFWVIGAERQYRPGRARRTGAQGKHQHGLSCFQLDAGLGGELEALFLGDGDDAWNRLQL